MPAARQVTDVLDISINLKGGELDRAELLEYPLRKDTPNTPCASMSREPPAALYLLQSGLAGGAGSRAHSSGDMAVGRAELHPCARRR
jgi:YidC/Oxa1 family membrane protein insertase